MSWVLLPYIIAILILTIRTTFRGEMPDTRVLLWAGIAAILLSPTIYFQGTAVHSAIWWSFFVLLFINILHFVLVSARQTLYNPTEMKEHRRQRNETEKLRSKKRSYF